MTSVHIAMETAVKHPYPSPYNNSATMETRKVGKKINNAEAIPIKTIYKLTQFHIKKLTHSQ